MTIVCVDDHSVMLKGTKQSVEQILPDASVAAASTGEEMGSTFAQIIFYDSVGYSLATRYQVTGLQKVRFESASKYSGDARLYVAGIYSGGSPMTVSELYATADQSKAPEGMTPVSERLFDNGRAMNLGGFNFNQKKASRRCRSPCGKSR